MSMELIFLLVFIKAIDVPVYFGSDRVFIGWGNVLDLLSMPRNIVAVLCIIGVVWSEIAYLLFRHNLKGSPTTISKTLNKVKNIDVEYMSLLLSILTIICFDFGSIRDVIIFVIVFALYWIISIHTELYATNPLLRVRKMHLYSATVDNMDEGAMFLSLEELKQGESVNRQFKKISSHAKRRSSILSNLSNMRNVMRLLIVASYNKNRFVPYITE